MEKDRRREQHRELIQRFVGAATPEHRHAVERFCRRVFPLSAQHLAGTKSDDGPLYEWRRNRRVAWPEVLDIYLHKIVGTELVSTELTRRAVESLDDADAFTALCAPLTPVQIEDLLQRLGDTPTTLRRNAPSRLPLPRLGSSKPCEPTAPTSSTSDPSPPSRGPSSCCCDD
jgi:hypothetical protein